MVALAALLVLASLGAPASATAETCSYAGPAPSSGRYGYRWADPAPATDACQAAQQFQMNYEEFVQLNGTFVAAGWLVIVVALPPEDHVCDYSGPSATNGEYGYLWVEPAPSLTACELARAYGANYGEVLDLNGWDLSNLLVAEVPKPPPVPGTVDQELNAEQPAGDIGDPDADVGATTGLGDPTQGGDAAVEPQPDANIDDPAPVDGGDPIQAGFGSTTDVDPPPPGSPVQADAPSGEVSQSGDSWLDDASQVNEPVTGTHVVASDAPGSAVAGAAGSTGDDTLPPFEEADAWTPKTGTFGSHRRRCAFRVTRPRGHRAQRGCSVRCRRAVRARRGSRHSTRGSSGRGGSACRPRSHARRASSADGSR